MTMIFVSFDSQDRDVAELAVLALREFNPSISFFWTGDSLQGGKPWFPQIAENLRAASGIISLVTSNTTGTNNWLNFEAGAAVGGGKPMLGILAPGITIPLDLSRPLQELQLTTWSDRRTLSRELAAMGLCISADAIERLVSAFTPFKIQRLRYGADDRFIDFTPAELRAFERELENRKQIVIGNHLIGDRDPCPFTPKVLYAKIVRNGVSYDLPFTEGTVVRRSSFFR